MTNLYPALPGYKENTTSKEAAERMEIHANKYRDIVLREIEMHGSGTAKEIAARLNLSLDIVRPRLTELKQQGKLTWVGRRDRQNIWGIYKDKLL